MYSVVLVAPGTADAHDRTVEIAARSMVWLVSAVVAGVVRDVTAACPPTWPIAELMEGVGGGLVGGGDEAERLSNAAALVRCPRVLALHVGFHPEGPLADELNAVEHRLSPDGTALVLRAPSTPLQRLLPDRAPAVGLVLPRERLRDAAQPLHRLTRTRGVIRLRTRMVPVL